MAPTDRGERRSHDEERRESGISAARAARRAMRQVRELTGREPESVVSIEHDDGWRVGVEVVETHRIPNTSDILAVYQADLDEDGRLRSYHRSSRYPRGRTQDE